MLNNLYPQKVITDGVILVDEMIHGVGPHLKNLSSYEGIAGKYPDLAPQVDEFIDTYMAALGYMENSGDNRGNINTAILFANSTLAKMLSTVRDITADVDNKARPELKSLIYASIQSYDAKFVTWIADVKKARKNIYGS